MGKAGIYIFYFIICNLCILTSCSKDQIGAEQAQKFVKFFGGSGSDSPKDLIKYKDGYALTGSMKTANGVNQAFIILTDKYGNEIPASPLMLDDNKHNGTGNVIFKLNNDDLIVVGTIANDTANTDIRVWRVNSAGNISWGKSFGGNLREEGLFGIENESGELIFGGYTESYGNGMKDVYLIKTDSMGNTIWASAFGGAGDDIGYDLVEMNGSLYVAGSSESFNYAQKKRDMFVINIDTATGKALNVALYGDSTYEQATKLIALPGNDLLIMGQRNSNNVQTNQIILYRTDNNLVAKWNKVLPVQTGYEIGSSLFLYNNTLHILGTSYKNQDSDFKFYDFDLDGNVINSTAIVLGGNQISAAGLMNDDGTYTYTGSNISRGFKQIVLIKGLR